MKCMHVTQTRQNLILKGFCCTALASSGLWWNDTLNKSEFPPFPAQPNVVRITRKKKRNVDDYIRFTLFMNCTIRTAMLLCWKSLFTQVQKTRIANVPACTLARWRSWPVETESLLVRLLCSGVTIQSLWAGDYERKTLERLWGFLTLGVQSAGLVRISCGPTGAGERLSVRPDQEHPHELCFRRCQSQREVCVQNFKRDLDLTCWSHRIVSMNNCVCRVIDLKDPALLGTVFDTSWFTFVYLRLILEFELRTKEESGLLLYMARINHADFVSIQVPALLPKRPFFYCVKNLSKSLNPVLVFNKD